LLGALGVTLVAFTDTTLTARAFLARSDPPLDAAAELRAMSVGNIAAGFLQGMPVSSSGSRTALAKATGARSQGYSLVAALLLVAVLVVAAPALSVLPKAGLAALVIYAGAKLIDIGQFRELLRFSRVEFLLAVVSALGVLVVGILYGILIAVALSVLAMLARVARPPSAALGFVPGLPGMHDIADFPQVTEVPGLLIFRYDSTLFFANAEDFRSEARRLVAEREPELRWVALNCEAMVSIDSTGLHALVELVHELRAADITVCLVRAKQDLQQQLRRAGVLELVGTEHVYATLPELVADFRHQTIV
jgi:MFS superfamily sulfate permease-like transporter